MKFTLKRAWVCAKQLLTLPAAPLLVRTGVILYLEYQSVCPIVGIGPPPPSPQASVSPPLDPKGGATLSYWWGDGETQLGRLDKKPGTQYTLCPSGTVYRSTESCSVEQRLKLHGKNSICYTYEFYLRALNYHTLTLSVCGMRLWKLDGWGMVVM